MSDLDPVQILADLTEQGLADETDVTAVQGTVGLWQRTPGFDPAAWTYDPDADPADDVYAPTAAEMYPQMVPKEGWPPQSAESAGVTIPTGSVEPPAEMGAPAGPEAELPGSSLASDESTGLVTQPVDSSVEGSEGLGLVDPSTQPLVEEAE